MHFDDINKIRNIRPGGKPPPSQVFKQVALTVSFRGEAGFPHMSKPCLHEERSAFSVVDSHTASCYA